MTTGIIIGILGTLGIAAFVARKIGLDRTQQAVARMFKKL